MVINLTDIPTLVAMDMAKWHKTTKIRIQGAFESKIRYHVSQKRKTLEIWRLKLILALNESIIDALTSKNDSINERLESHGVRDFERKFSDDDIYRLMLSLPTELKKSPKLISIQKMFNVSKRQAVKIREMIPKDVYGISVKKS